MLRFYAIDSNNNERQLSLYGEDLTTTANIRSYLSKIKNNWWWKYLTSFGTPNNDYNFYREDYLIRALCNRENSTPKTPSAKRIKILYDWFYQNYDPSDSKPAIYNGQKSGWYYIQDCY